METQSYYKKIGRGGVGNYYSKQDIEEVTKQAAEDLEAQQQQQQQNHHHTVSATTIGTSSETPPRSDYYAISGRGGAGNFIVRKENDNDGINSSTIANVVPLSTITPSSTATKVGGYYSGRGGIGNVRTAEVERLREEAQAKAKEARERAHDEVVRDVGMGLKMPERAHLGVEKLE